MYQSCVLLLLMTLASFSSHDALWAQAPTQESATKPAEKSGSGAPDAKREPIPPNRVVRLYHLRKAADVATLLNSQDSANPVVQALGDQLLLILPPKDPPNDRFWELMHYISLLDLPRPQIGLEVWSVQLSSKDPVQVQTDFEQVREVVDRYNQRLVGSLEGGWTALWGEIARVGGEEKFFDPDFREYLTTAYDSCRTSKQYCLGYRNALLAGAPSLARMLLYLAGAKDVSSAAKQAVEGMEDAAACAEHPKKSEQKEKPLCLRRFKQALEYLLREPQLRVFRAAWLDFLFEAKWAIQYERGFAPNGFQSRANTLDALLTPVVQGFNRDLDEYLEGMQYASDWPVQKKVHKVGDQGLYSRGLVKVVSLSDQKADVAGSVTNYFEIPSTLSLSDILKSNTDVEGALKNILQPKEIKIAEVLANIAAQPRITAEISRGMKLTITPFALNTASSVELVMVLDVSEPSGPKVVGSSDDKSVDTLDRVASHTVNTDVRVESLKLFEVSTFSMQLTHPTPDFVIPPIGQVWDAVFGPIPGFGRLFHLRRSPTQTDNRSMAIVQAVVEPTAYDLFKSLTFDYDKDEQNRIVRDELDLHFAARKYHAEYIRCVLSARPEKRCTEVAKEAITSGKE